MPNKTAIEVRQGNANAKSIDFESDSYLFTLDLNPCIAILIVDQNTNKCHMIHCDTTSSSSIGGTTLKTSFDKLGVMQSKTYDIGLIGGASPESINKIKNEVERLLPRATVKTIAANMHTAYLADDGFMTDSKEKLKAHLSEKQRPGIGFRR